MTTGANVSVSAMTKTADHPASLVALKSAIRVSLVAKDPLATKDVSARKPGNQCSSAVPLKSVELVLQRGELMRITEGCLDRGSKW